LAIAPVGLPMRPHRISGGLAVLVHQCLGQISWLIETATLSFQSGSAPQGATAPLIVEWPGAECLFFLAPSHGRVSRRTIFI